MHVISPSSESYLYEQVEGLVKGMIDDGVLKVGERVPSIRAMSRKARVSMATVMQAYLALENKGYVESRPKSGFYVRPRRGPEASVPRKSNPRMRPRRVERQDLIDSILAVSHESSVVSLGIANPSAELLPVKGLTRALRQVASRYPLEAMQYCFERGGDDELRKQIALRGADLGCSISPREIITTVGATEALAVALNTVARPGDVIAVESPTYFYILQLIERLGMLALEVRTHPDTGMDLEALRQALDNVPVKAVMSVANFSNPLGSLMPDAAKQQLVELLSERQIPLIEDDIYGDLYFGESRPRIAKCFDREGLVLTCSSFSKTIAPGYRVGWLLPGKFGDEATKWKLSMSGVTAALPQLAIAEFLRTGNYDRHLRRLRKAYRDQVEQMRYTIAREFPDGTRITRPSGGFVLWVELPKPVDGTELFEKSLAEGVSVTPGVVFSSTDKYKNCIRISCGMPWSARIEAAVATVGRIAGSLASTTMH
jgi:DNA-binding transcriptional MocR family regulator